jgi:hypothetical protein
MQPCWRPRKWLDKKIKMGFRGYPVGTIAFYGPDDQHASKIAVAVIIAPDSEPIALRRWFAGSGDVRKDTAAFEEIAYSSASLGRSQHPFLGMSKRKPSTELGCLKTA